MVPCWGTLSGFSDYEYAATNIHGKCLCGYVFHDLTEILGSRGIYGAEEVCMVNTAICQGFFQNSRTILHFYQRWHLGADGYLPSQGRILPKLLSSILLPEGSLPSMHSKGRN